MKKKLFKQIKNLFETGGIKAFTKEVLYVFRKYGIIRGGGTVELDMIHTLTFIPESVGVGSFPVRLNRNSPLGENQIIEGEAYWRNGTSGQWNLLKVSQTTELPITSNTMQIGHLYNREVNEIMVASFGGGDKIKTITIENNPILTVGNNFMSNYASYCTNLTSLGVPDTSSLTTVDSSFMANYASYCTNLTSLESPDTSNITSVGGNFMNGYANECTKLTSLGVPDTSSLTTVDSSFMSNYAYKCTNLTSLESPDTSNITSVGGNFMNGYANRCTKLTSLGVPDTSSLTTVHSSFMANYASYCTNLTSLESPDTSNITAPNISFMSEYAKGCFNLTTLGIPDTSSMTTSEFLLMDAYAEGCGNLSVIKLPSVGIFASNNINWKIPSSLLGVLTAQVTVPQALVGWKNLVTTGKTLYTNQIRNASKVQ